MMRMSLHDPVLPMNVESNSENGCFKMVKDLYYFLKKYDFLDVSPLEKYIEEWRAKKRKIAVEKLEAYTLVHGE